MSSCTVPVSWLKLERYHLRELSEESTLAVADHLENCGECSKCLERIQNDVRCLPAIEAVKIYDRPQYKAVWAVAAAVCLLVIGAFYVNIKEERSRSEITSVKGIGQSIVVIRERSGVIVENPIGYTDGDRFSIEVTCASLEHSNDQAGLTEWDVVIFQNNKAYFPFDNSRPIRCGNRVHLPGAFRLTGGEDAVVLCVIMGQEIPNREELSKSTPDQMPKSAICNELKPLQ